MTEKTNLHQGERGDTQTHRGLLGAAGVGRRQGWGTSTFERPEESSCGPGEGSRTLSPAPLLRTSPADVPPSLRRCLRPHAEVTVLPRPLFANGNIKIRSSPTAFVETISNYFKQRKLKSAYLNCLMSY